MQTIRCAVVLTAGLLMTDIGFCQSVPSAPEIQHIVAKSTALPFSLAVRAGDTVYLSGQIGGIGGKLADGFDAQARQAMDNILAATKQAGLSADNIVKCTIMMADMKQWDAFNAVYRNYFKPGHFPARSAFGVTGLAFNADLEIECIAYDPSHH